MALASAKRAQGRTPCLCCLDVDTESCVVHAGLLEWKAGRRRRKEAHAERPDVGGKAVSSAVRQQLWCTVSPGATKRYRLPQVALVTIWLMRNAQPKVNPHDSARSERVDGVLQLEVKVRQAGSMPVPARVACA